MLNLIQTFSTSIKFRIRDNIATGNVCQSPTLIHTCQNSQIFSMHWDIHPFASTYEGQQYQVFAISGTECECDAVVHAIGQLHCPTRCVQSYDT